MTDTAKPIKRIKRSNKPAEEIKVGDRVNTELGPGVVCEIKGSYTAVISDRGIRMLIPGRPAKAEEQG